MRLTLRTLLGWKDATLPPAEHEFIGSRVAQSRLASSLAERITTVLSIPPAALPGERLAFYTDHLNSAAEYLDNVLPSNELAGFERRCLESLQHLEEVAAVHAILADAFHDGGAARAMPSMRRRRMIAHVRASRRPAPADRPAVTVDVPSPPPTPSLSTPAAPAPATSVRAEDFQSSQEAARRLLEEFAGVRSSPKPPAPAPAAARVWPEIKPAAVLESLNVAASVSPAVAKPVAATPVKPRFSVNHGQWVKLLMAAVALAAILSVGGALASSLQGPRAYKPEPGCLHCTEP